MNSTYVPSNISCKLILFFLSFLFSYPLSLPSSLFFICHSLFCYSLSSPILLCFTRIYFHNSYFLFHFYFVYLPILSNSLALLCSTFISLSSSSFQYVDFFHTESFLPYSLVSKFTHLPKVHLKNKIKLK